MTFLNPALLLLRQSTKYLAQISAQLHVKYLPSILGNEHDVVFALPFCGLGFQTRPLMELHMRVLWRLTFRSFIDGRPGAYPRKCQTSAASPAKPGELPLWYGLGGVFVTSAVRDVLSNSIWHSRLQPVAVDLRDAPIGRFQIHQAGLQIYQLANV